MKKTLKIILVAFFAFGFMLIQQLQAQAPSKMSYQAVVRSATNELVVNQKVGMQISILQGSASGTAVYIETQEPTSNTNGLVSLAIGAGTAVSGDFSTIDWSASSHFIKTEIDPTGGTSYTVTGTSQLLSVPYALYAKTAGNSSGSSFDGKFTSLTDVPDGLSDGDNDTQLTETQVDAFVANNGYLSAEVDGSVINEINTSVVLDGTDLKVTDSGGTITTDLSSLSTIALEHQLFVSSGTFTVPSNVTQIRVTLIGGGGGGGGRAAGPNVGDGGAAGAYVRNQIETVTPNSVLAVNVGAGGAASTCSSPASSSCTVNAGGSSSVAALVTAAGGAGGCASCLAYDGSDVSGDPSPFGVFGSGGSGRTDSNTPDYIDIPATAGSSGMVLIEYYFW